LGTKKNSGTKIGQKNSICFYVWRKFVWNSSEIIAFTVNAFFTCLTPILTFSFLDDKSLEFQQHWISKWFTKMTTLHLENNKSKNWIFIFSSFYGMLTGNRLKISKNNWNCAFTECRMFRQKWWSVDEEIRFANNFHLIERNSSCWTTSS
jgi:hypothetical protein